MEKYIIESINIFHHKIQHGCVFVCSACQQTDFEDKVLPTESPAISAQWLAQSMLYWISIWERHGNFVSSMQKYNLQRNYTKIVKKKQIWISCATQGIKVMSSRRSMYCTYYTIYDNQRTSSGLTAVNKGNSMSYTSWYCTTHKSVITYTSKIHKLYL